jgi:hypothetical protein
MARSAAKESPGDPEIMKTLGLAEVRNDLWDEAAATLQKAIDLHGGTDGLDFLFLAMAQQGSGKMDQAQRNFARGSELVSKPADSDPEQRMLWGEAADVLGKPGPGPTLYEVKADPEGSMQRLQRAAAGGYLNRDVLEHSADLQPLRNRPDFQALLRNMRSSAPPTRALAQTQPTPP